MDVINKCPIFIGKWLLNPAIKMLVISINNADSAKYSKMCNITVDILSKRTSILPTIVSRKSVPFEGDLLGEEAHR